MTKAAAIEFTSGPDRLGRRQFCVTWTSPEMRRAHEECEGSCCVRYLNNVDDAFVRKAPSERGHRSQRSQFFFTAPEPAITYWREHGYDVTIIDDDERRARPR